MKLLASIVLLGFAATAAADPKGTTSPYAGVAAEQIYDSNVMNRYGADAVTRVTPRVGIIHESDRLRYLGEYRLGLHAYAGGAADNSINHRGALGLKWRTTPRLTLDADATLTIGDDPVLIDRPGVIIPLGGGFTDVQAHTGIAWRATRRTTLSLEYLARVSRFELAGEPDVTAYDGDEHRLDGAVAWRATRRWTLKAIGRGQRFVSYGSTSSLEWAAGAGAGFEVRLAPLWRARAQGGGLVYAGSSVPGWFALADLTRSGERWRVALRGIHDVYGGTSAAEAVWSESVQLDGALRLARYLGLRARAGAYRGGPAPNYDSHVQGVQGSLSLGWLVWPGARLDLYAEHRMQDASFGRGFGDVQRTVAGVRLTAIAGLDLLSLGETP